MAVILQWGSAFFHVVPDQIYRPGAITHTLSVDQKTNEDIEGAPPANPSPKKKEVISFEIDMSEFTGVRVRGTIDVWRGLAGEKHALFIGGQPYGPELMQLTSVNVEDMEINDLGEIYSATLTLEFTEYAPEPAGQKSSSASTSSGLSLSLTDMGSAKSALGIGPSTQEKQQLKASNPMMEPM